MAQPMTGAALAYLPQAERTLAAWPVVFMILLILRGLGLTVQEATVAQVKNHPENAGQTLSVRARSGSSDLRGRAAAGMDALAGPVSGRGIAPAAGPVVVCPGRRPLGLYNTVAFVIRFLGAGRSGRAKTPRRASTAPCCSVFWCKRRCWFWARSSTCPACSPPRSRLRWRPWRSF